MRRCVFFNYDICLSNYELTLEKEDSLIGMSTHFLSISRKQKDDSQKISN